MRSKRDSKRCDRTDRRYQRFDVDGLSGNLRFTVEVEILNLSAGGMQVRTPSYLAVGRIYSFNLVQGEKVASVQGRIAWCELSGTQRLENGDVVPSYTAGIAFENILTEQGAALVGLLEKTVVLEFQRRIFGRFQDIDEIREAKASGELEFLIRRISMSGMYIESEATALTDSVLTLEIGFGDDLFQCQGRVVHLNEETEDSPQGLGIEFLDLDESASQALHDFIDSEFCLVDDEVDSS